MKKYLIFLLIIFNFYQISCAFALTAEEAKEKAFSNIQTKVDISKYPSKDPNFTENQQALKEGKEIVSNRFITANDDPEIAYVVSELDERQRPLNTMFYKRDSSISGLRLFSSQDYPQSTYIYCMQNEYRDGKRTYGVGELMNVSFSPSDRETFFFGAEGEFQGHVKN